LDKFLAQRSFVFPSKPILLIDGSGDASPGAAKLLIEKGFKDVSILFEGMEGWNDYVTSAAEKPALKCTKFVSYDFLSAENFDKMLKDKKDIALIDVRTKEEFNNTSKSYWQNIGQVKGAIHIPSSEIGTSSSLPVSKEIPVVVYGFNNQDNIFQSAKKLKDFGYKNVYILQNGIWGLRWTAHNIKGKSYLNDLVINVPPENE